MDIWQSPSQVLKKFDVDEDGALDFNEFRTLCFELFGEDDISEADSKVLEVFQFYDANRDGLLNNEEWERCYQDWISKTVNPKNVLIVVDLQNDFIDGTLALKKCPKGDDGNDVVKPINDLIEKGKWDKTFYSLDWHPENHISFYDNLHLRSLHPDSKVSKEDAKVFDKVLFAKSKSEQVLWPRHCVIDTWGAQLHKDLVIAENSEKIQKGKNPEKEEYSAFCSEFVEKLREFEATHVFVCGLAYDVCVKSTCLDALKLGYRVAIIEDCCSGTDNDSVALSRREIENNGGFITCSEEALKIVNYNKKSFFMALNNLPKV